MGDALQVTDLPICKKEGAAISSSQEATMLCLVQNEDAQSGSLVSIFPKLGFMSKKKIFNALHASDRLQLQNSSLHNRSYCKFQEICATWEGAFLVS